MGGDAKVGGNDLQGYVADNLGALGKELQITLAGVAHENGVLELHKEHLVIGHHQAPAAEFKVDVEELVVVAPAQANQSCGCAGLDVAGAAFAQV